MPVILARGDAFEEVARNWLVLADRLFAVSVQWFTSPSYPPQVTEHPVVS
jgi:hypothetical protein